MSKKKILSRQMIFAWLIFLEALAVILLTRSEKALTLSDRLNAYSLESDEVRALPLGENGLEQICEHAKLWGEEVWPVAGVYLVRKIWNGQDSFPDYLEYKSLCEEFETEKPVEWAKLVNGIQTILSDIRFFPVASDCESGLKGICYENGWGDSRTYGGNRRHEGTDIMDNENIRGNFPIVSVSDGVVENIGWLEKGGYRIGIRSPGGAYFYYAHLACYAETFTPGEKISAGRLVGYMGDTGYSAVEGTVGNFPVHLHFGIYLKTDHFDEMSVNPYYILKYLEKYTVSYTKQSFLWYSE